MATRGFEHLTEADVRRMGRQGPKSPISVDSSHLKSPGKGKVAPPASMPQKASKYRAVPCVVTDDLTLFTKEDIARSFKASRDCEPDDAWLGRPLQELAQAENIIGQWFGSLKEGRRYIELKALEKAGEIWDLELQPPFPLLVPSTTGTLRGAGKALAGTFNGRIGEYRGDFKYHDRTTEPYVVEDVKGFKTALYKWKKKHVEKQYGIQIREIRFR